MMFSLSFVEGSETAERGPNPLAELDRGGPNPLAGLDPSPRIRICGFGPGGSWHVETNEEIKHRKQKDEEERKARAR